MSCRGPGTAAAASQPPSRYHARCLALPKTPASHRDGATLRPTPPLFSAPRDIAVPQDVLPGPWHSSSKPPSRYHARCLTLPKTPANHRHGATHRPTPGYFSAPRDIAAPQEVSTGQGQATTTSDLLSFPHARRSLISPALPPPREQGRYRPSTAPSYYYAMTSLLLPHHQTGGLAAPPPTFAHHCPTVLLLVSLPRHPRHRGL